MEFVTHELSFLIGGFEYIHKSLREELASKKRLTSS
jgi:hypothetical protein